MTKIEIGKTYLFTLKSGCKYKLINSTENKQDSFNISFPQLYSLRKVLPRGKNTFTAEVSFIYTYKSPTKNYTRYNIIVNRGTVKW